MPNQPDKLHRGDVISSDYLNRVADAVLQRISVVGGRISRHGTSLCIEVDEARKVTSRSTGIIDSPYTINPTYGDFEADTLEWDKDDRPAGTRGLELNITTRVVYDYTAYKLYAFSRVLTFDDQGCLALVSEEIRQTVDTLVQCPPEE